MEETSESTSQRLTQLSIHADRANAEKAVKKLLEKCEQQALNKKKYCMWFSEDHDHPEIIKEILQGPPHSLEVKTAKGAHIILWGGCRMEDVSMDVAEALMEEQRYRKQYPDSIATGYMTCGTKATVI